MLATRSRAGQAVGIRAQGLTKRYGHAVVVNDLSFTAKPGAVTGFLGPNGAGKSTTLRILLGLVKPTKRTITIGSRQMAELEHPTRTIGALLDARAIHPYRTVFDHLLVFAHAAGLGEARVHEVLGLAGLTNAAGRRARELSLGMCQRLGIATALLGNPQVLVFDEPLNGLDPEGIRWMRNLMRSLASEGRTILFSSHLMSEMELTADNLIVIGRGRLIAEASLVEFVHTHTTNAVTVRTASWRQLAEALGRIGIGFEEVPGSGLIVTGTDSSAVGKIAAAEGIALDELTPSRESLEDVFLRLTRDATEYEGQAA